LSAAMAESGLVRQLTSTSDQKTALQFAFYNAVIFVLTGICLLGVYAVYRMLYMFLTPLMWAILVGTILFPLKRRITSGMNGWLTKLDDEDTPLIIGILLLPYNALTCVADLLLYYAVRREGVMVMCTYLLLKVLGYGTFVYCIGCLGEIYHCIDSFIIFFIKKWMLPIMVFYLAAYAGWIYVQDKEKINKKFARVLSIPVWIFMLSFIASFCGPLRVIVFVTMSAFLGLIAAGVISAEEEGEPVQSSEVRVETPGGASDGDSGRPHELSTSESVSSLGKALTGDFYIQAIFGLCVLLFAARHDAVMAVNAQAGISSLACSAWQMISAKADRFVHVTVAGSLRKFVKLLFTSDKLLMSKLHASLDVLSSVAVMAVLAFGLLFTLLFVGFQLHCEALHLAKLGSNVLAAQPDWLGFARNYTEDQLSQHDIDDYVEQAYRKGRLWLADNIRSWVDPKDPERAEQVEAQVMQLIDNVYKMWEERDSQKAESETTHAIAKGNWLSQLKSAELGALKRELTEVLQQNIDTVLNVARSVWSVVLMNVSLFGSFFISAAGVIIGFGLDIVNFLIEMIVFLTAVYYLLASSGEQWLPVKWISEALPKASNAGGDADSAFNVKHISAAIENSISGVFVLSAKMAVFYGLYTYFVHTLFDLNIVFLPSMLAALFAAIPVMAPYLVCAIGIFELYLVRGETAAAIVFFMLSAAPMAFADAAFYRQLRGSHPYVTGLAIIGGMYWLGLQGAIIGPIILCLLLVLFQVYAKFANA
uniref:Transmembrane protein n=1 Tax=Toxocara canis TaxID=6265 RepID=A0A183V031_TOXCA